MHLHNKCQMVPIREKCLKLAHLSIECVKISKICDGTKQQFYHFEKVAN